MNMEKNNTVTNAIWTVSWKWCNLNSELKVKKKVNSELKVMQSEQWVESEKKREKRKRVTFERRESRVYTVGENNMYH